MYKCHSITTVLFFYSTFLIYILPYNILISILIYISTSITKVFFLVSLKMTGTGYRYPSTRWLHAIIAHHFKSESHFTSKLYTTLYLQWTQSAQLECNPYSSPERLELVFLPFLVGFLEFHSYQITHTSHLTHVLITIQTHSGYDFFCHRPVIKECLYIPQC